MMKKSIQKNTKHDLSFLEFKDIDLMPVFHFDGFPIRDGWVDEINTWPFDKDRAKRLSETTGLQPKIAEYFFRANGPETFDDETEQDKFYDECIDDLHYEAQRFRPLKPFLERKHRDDESISLVFQFVRYRPGQSEASKEWSPHIYLKRAVRRSILFALIMGLLFLLNHSNKVWIGFCVLIVSIGIYVIAGIPKRYRLRKELAAFMKEQGVSGE